MRGSLFKSKLGLNKINKMYPIPSHHFNNNKQYKIKPSYNHNVNNCEKNIREIINREQQLSSKEFLKDNSDEWFIDDIIIIRVTKIKLLICINNINSQLIEFYK